VVAFHRMGVAVSDPARLAGLDLEVLAGSGPQALAGLGPQVLAGSIRRPVDSDLAPAFVHLVQGSERLLHRTGHSRREALCPTGASSGTGALDLTGFTAFAIAVFSLTIVSDAAHPSFRHFSSIAGYFSDRRSILITPASMATLTGRLRQRNRWS